MARTKKTTNKNEVTVNNPAQVLPAPAVDDATTTKGAKVKPIAPDVDDKDTSKTAVFAALRSWLKIDSDTTAANDRALELIGEGIAPLEAVKQAQKECRGRGSESCTVSAFIAEVEKYPNIKDIYNLLGVEKYPNVKDIYNLLGCDGLAVGDGNSDTKVTTYHAPGDDDDEGSDYQTATATATVLGVTFSECYRYKVRPATWLSCWQALRSCTMPAEMAAKAARRGKELRKQAQALSEICKKLIEKGADPARIREYIPAGILNA